jgi:hypothetical protein
MGEDPKPKAEKQLVFITLQDFQTRMKDIDKLKEFINDISCLYETGEWVIETGGQKNQEDFNVHVHLLVKIAKHVKNHKRDIDTAWRRKFPTSLYDKDFYLLKQWRKSKAMPSYETWIEEKQQYFTQEGKSDEHKNTLDLGLGGTF